MIDVDEALERISNDDDDVICREYELRPQIIANLIENVAKITEKHGYVIIGVGKNGKSYNINGIGTRIDVEHLVKLALQQVIPQIKVEYLVQTLAGKKICVICVYRYENNQKLISDVQENIDKEVVFRDLFNACIKLQKNTTFTNVSEDQRNDFIRDILETAGYQIKDQTRQGKSTSGKASGEIDILIHDKGKPISIIEALNLNGLVTAYLDEHIDKIYKYDTLGNAFNFLVSYVKVKEFGEFWDKYVKHIKNYKYPYALVDVNENIQREYEYADIRYIITIHNRNGKETILYHICMKIVE